MRDKPFLAENMEHPGQDSVVGNPTVHTERKSERERRGVETDGKREERFRGQKGESLRKNRAGRDQWFTTISMLS